MSTIVRVNVTHRNNECSILNPVANYYDSKLSSGCTLAGVTHMDLEGDRLDNWMDQLFQKNEYFYSWSMYRKKAWKSRFVLMCQLNMFWIFVAFDALSNRLCFIPLYVYPIWGNQFVNNSWSLGFALLITFSSFLFCWCICIIKYILLSHDKLKSYIYSPGSDFHVSRSVLFLQISHFLPFQ